MDYNYKSKSLEEIRKDFLLGIANGDKVLITNEVLMYIRQKIIFEEAQNKPYEFFNSLLKLISITDAHSKLPYKIDKIKILEYIKQELINKKAFEIAIRNGGISNSDPINRIMNIEIYELLLEYLENDKTINPDDCCSKHL